MIKQYNVKNNDTTYLRLWQKIQFGKEILPESLFDITTIVNTNHCYRLKVFQLDKDTRVFYLGRVLYSVNTADQIYNYLDTGRAVKLNIGSTRSISGRPQSSTIHIFNDLIIADKDIEAFEEYTNEDELNLKQLVKTDTEDIFLVYAEDIQKITAEMQTYKKQQEIEKENELQEELIETANRKKLMESLKDYSKLPKLEDDNTIISGRYFIDKTVGIKIEFTDDIVKIFPQNRLMNFYNTNIHDFIRLNYSAFLSILEKIYEISLYRDKVEDKIKAFNKNLLNFKVYSYNTETKEEKLLKEIKIDNIYKEEKIRFEVNGIKMPKQKMSKLFQFLRANNEPEAIKNRIINLESYAEQIKIYSGIQLKLLEGKTIDVHIDDLRVPIHFNIIAEDKENWKISLGDFSVRKTYKEIRETFYRVYGGGLEKISHICESLKADSKLEEIIINTIKGYKEKREQAEARAEQLFIEFLTKNKGRIFSKDNGYIVKGKLKNYLVKMKDKENAGVWTYPANEYVCINQKTRAGQYLCKYDKLLQFCIAMLNDGNLKQEIYTLH